MPNISTPSTPKAALPETFVIPQSAAAPSLPRRRAAPSGIHDFWMRGGEVKNLALEVERLKREAAAPPIGPA